MVAFRPAVLSGIILAAGWAAPAAAQEVVVRGRPEKTEQWVQKLLLWRSWYTPGSKDPAQTREAARRQIEAIDDPAAIPAIVLVLKTEKEHRFRQALLWPLITMGGKDAVAALVRVSVLDDNPLLRQEAADALACQPELPEFLDQYIGYLYKPKFAAAAAQALQRTRLATREMADPIDPRLAKALIAALVQDQEERRVVSAPYEIRFPGGGRRSGVATRRVDVPISTPNPAALETLKEYSYRDHGYNQQRWTESLIYSQRR